MFLLRLAEVTADPSYDSHVVTRRRMADELPRLKADSQPDSYTAQQMDLEIQRVSRELYKARYQVFRQRDKLLKRTA